MKLARIREPETGEAIRGKVANGGTIETPSGNYDPAEVELLPPAKPSKIVCVGLNYTDHVEETGAEIPDRPSFFFKPPSAVVGPGEPIVISQGTRSDPEAEVAVVIDETCRNVEEAEAWSYVRGFTGLNDVTNREAQEWEQNWVRAKAFDTAAPLGPYVVPPDEVELPLSFRLEVNGEVRQSSKTSELIFDIPELLAEITSFMTLKPGDVVSTGTPRGIAPIEAGDEVSLRIDGVGTLKNPVRS